MLRRPGDSSQPEQLLLAGAEDETITTGCTAQVQISKFPFGHWRRY
jgi:hypothetical protein